MPNSRPEEEPLREEPDIAIVSESADEQDQNGPRCHDGKTFMKHGREAMEEHAELGKLLAQ